MTARSRLALICGALAVCLALLGGLVTGSLWRPVDISRATVETRPRDCSVALPALAVRRHRTEPRRLRVDCK